MMGDEILELCSLEREIHLFKVLYCEMITRCHVKEY